MTPPPDSHDEWRAVAAAYALDALDPAERAAFVSHLATCAECQALVGSYAPVVTGLGLAVEPEAPPAGLRERTLARATSQPQTRATVSPMRATPPRPAMPVVPPPTARGPSWFLLAASIAAAVGLGMYAWSLREQVAVLRTIAAEASAEVQNVRAELAAVRRDSTRLASAVTVLSATDLRRVDLAGQARAATATARAYVSQTHGLVFSAQNLPALAAGHVYQVWVLAPTPVSAGVLTPAKDGSATATMPMPGDVSPAAITAVAVTDEPNLQGSATPTMPILLVGNVSR
jgi:hypothetical protein